VVAQNFNHGSRGCVTDTRGFYQSRIAHLSKWVPDHLAGGDVQYGKEVVVCSELINRDARLIAFGLFSGRMNTRLIGS
jgi:hypothetical protein